MSIQKVSSLSQCCASGCTTICYFLVLCDHRNCYGLCSGYDLVWVYLNISKVAQKCTKHFYEIQFWQLSYQLSGRSSGRWSPFCFYHHLFPPHYNVCPWCLELGKRTLLLASVSVLSERYKAFTQCENQGKSQSTHKPLYAWPVTRAQREASCGIPHSFAAHVFVTGQAEKD